jgi:radical SAM superfamily enzyme YgiQ (UPF0313 family)
MKKTRVVLATAPVSIKDRYGQYHSAANTQPSFGVASLAAAAERAGAEVVVIEASSHDLGVEETARRATQAGPDILGISSTSIGITASAELALATKQRNPGILTVIGGCHVSALPEETLRDFPAFDLAVRGEGEATLADIIERMRCGEALPTDVAGTCVSIDGDIKINPDRPPIENLDSLPLPAWHLIEGFPRSFKPSPARIMRWPCASIVMTRGCPNACTFCDRSVFGRKCRSYSAKYAADLCQDLSTNYGVKEILIEDDTFIISRANVAEFCEELIRRDINISWSCLGRADRVDRELLVLMKRAGCWHISFGIESGDAAILRSVNKNLNLEQISSASSACRTAGLRTKGFFMVGFPDESESSINATVDLVKVLPLDDISVMHLTPFPGSELARNLEITGNSNRNWKSMNALTPVFVPEGMTAAELEDASRRIYKAFFSRFDVIARHAMHAVKHPRIIPFYFAGATSLAKSMLAGNK